MLYLILSGFIFCVCAYLYSQKRPKDFPKGPYGVPFLGNLLQLGPKPFVYLIKLKEKYGPIVSINFGSYRSIGISDYQILREALANPAFSGRPNMNVFQHRSRDVVPRGILFTEGQSWTEQRRFTLKHLKDLGYAKTSAEVMIQEEVMDFIYNLKNECDHPISLRMKFHAPVLNILWSMIVGERSSNEEVTELFRKSTDSMERNNVLESICMFLPWFAKLFPTFSGMQDTNEILRPLWMFFDKHIAQHKLMFVPGVVRDFTDAYIQEIHDTTDPSSSFFKATGDKSMMSTLLDLFFAGGDTTSTSLNWLCLFLAKHPEVQEKLQQEIDSVIGRSRTSSLSDECSMPYTRAVIEESMRAATILPIGLFRSTTQDTTLKGYKIPKNTMVIMNYFSAFHDKEYWGDPEVFRPERFLDCQGKFVKHEPMSLMFGAGRRFCIGETLAKNQMFIWTSTLFQHFTITPDPVNPNLNMEPIVTWMQLPPNNFLMFKPRDL